MLSQRSVDLRQRLIENIEAPVKVLLRDHQRRADERPVEADGDVDAFRAAEGADAGHGRRRRSVERGEGLFRLPVLDQLEAAKEADGANLAHAGVTLLERQQTLLQEDAEITCSLDQPLLLVRLH